MVRNSGKNFSKAERGLDFFSTQNITVQSFDFENNNDIVFLH